MSHRHTCVVCDATLDPYGRDGTLCDRCARPCPTCGGSVSRCTHPLAVPYSRMSIRTDDRGGKVAA